MVPQIEIRAFRSAIVYLFTLPSSLAIFLLFGPRRRTFALSKTWISIQGRLGGRGKRRPYRLLVSFSPSASSTHRARRRTALSSRAASMRAGRSSVRERALGHARVSR